MRSYYSFSGYKISVVQNEYILKICCATVCLTTFESYKRLNRLIQSPNDDGTEAALQTPTFWYPNDSLVDQNEGRQISYD